MVYISYILVWSNIPHSIPTERQLANILFQTRCLYLIVFDFWPGHSRVGCSRLLTVCSRLQTVCSRFAHGFRGSFWVLYVLFESLRGSFWVLTRVCSRLLTVCSRLLTVAHGCSRLLTVCSRFGKGAQNPCAKFEADVFWEIFEPCHGANPGSATIPHMKDSFWAQRTQKVHLESSI